MIQEFEPVHRAELHLRRQRIPLVGLPRIEFSAEVPHCGAERERRSGKYLVLRPEIYRARALDSWPNAAALPRTVDAQLNELVVEAGAQTHRNFACIRAGKYDIAWENDTNDVVVYVGERLLSGVEDVDRDCRRAVRASG